MPAKKTGRKVDVKAKIIGQNHKVTTYSLNGRKRHIVEKIPVTRNRRVVNNVVRVVGRAWEDVYNYIDERFESGINPALRKCIRQMTY